MRVSSKEKKTVLWGIIVVFAVLFINFYILPMQKELRVLDSRVDINKDKLKKMFRLKAEYDALYRVMLHSNRKFEVKEDASLLTFLENLADKTAIKRKIAYIEPFTEYGGIKKEGARVKIDRVEISELVDFLYGLEHENSSVSVEEVTITTYSTQKHLLDVSFIIVSAE